MANPTATQHATENRQPPDWRHHPKLGLLSAAPVPGVVKKHREMQQIAGRRSEEHTSELQSRPHLVCRLLLEKKKKKKNKKANKRKYIKSENKINNIASQ